MLQSSVSKVLLSLMVLSVLPGCSAVKNMDEMKAKTNEMADTTKEMNNTTKEVRDISKEMSQTTKDMSRLTTQMNDRTDQMKGRTDELFDLNAYLVSSARQGQSRQLRQESLKAMESAYDLTPKVSAAGIYMMGFEFQLWRGTGSDTAEKRELLLRDAVREFFRDIHRYIRSDLSLDTLTIAPARRNLMAISSMLHAENDAMAVYMNERGYETTNMFEMIKEALLAKADIAAGKTSVKDQPEYIGDILTFEDVAIYLLRLRYNFLATMALADMGNFSKTPGDLSGLWGKIKVVGSAHAIWDPFGAFGHIQVDLEGRNLKKIEDYALWIETGLETREFLRSIKQPVTLEEPLARLYQNMTLKGGDKKQDDTVRGKAMARLVRAILDLRNPNKK